MEEQNQIIKVLDGGFSTQLAKYVGEKIDGDPLWTSRFLVTDPEAVFQTHLDYLRSGSDIIETNTYQASVTGFNEYLNLGFDESIQLIRGAVDLARNAVDVYQKESKDGQKRKILVAGSVGPYGASLHDGSEYTGSYGKNVTENQIKDWHRPRIRALLDAGCEILALETIPCTVEAEGLVNLLKEFPNAKAWLSFSCAQDGNKTLVDGSNYFETVLNCWNKVPYNDRQLIGIGINCIAPGAVKGLLEDLKKSNIPLVVYPNSGEVYSVETGWKYVGEKPPKPERFVKEWLDLGVKYIGGCCRTDNKDVFEIREQVKQWLNDKSKFGITAL